MNILNVSLQHSILTLAAHGWSRRRIARELDLDRETVGKYLRLARSKPAISTPGSEADRAAKPAILTPGSEGGTDATNLVPSDDEATDHQQEPGISGVGAPASAQCGRVFNAAFEVEISRFVIGSSRSRKLMF